MDLLRRLFGRKPSETSAVPDETPVEITQVIKRPRPSPVLGTRELPSPKAYATPTTRLKFGINSDVGGRGNNEDSALATLLCPELSGTPSFSGLFLVADGMGGHEDGERASSIAARTLAQHVLNEIFTPQLEEREHSSDQKTIPEILSEAMAAANTAVREQLSPGAGTTATCAMIQGDLAYIIHVGDSRAYLYADDNLEQITRGHRIVDRLVEVGQLTPEEAGKSLQNNVLYMAVGAGDRLEPDVGTHRLAPSTRLLLCSDGLWGVVGDASIETILRESADPQQVCDRLVAAANAVGGEDNITAVLVQMPD